MAGNLLLLVQEGITNALKHAEPTRIDIELEAELRPQGEARLRVHRADGGTVEVPLMLRIDTAIEVEYYRHGGILPYVLRQLLAD